MKIINWQNLSFHEQEQALARPAAQDDAAVRLKVAEIVRTVKARGDEALAEFSARFDGCVPASWRVPAPELAAAAAGIEAGLRSAIERAVANLGRFHESQRPEVRRLETMPGVTCELHWRPISAVGLYVPGGTAPLFSSLLMMAIPARIAGCPRLILCTPPQRDGKINPAVLAAASLCGLEEVYIVGGAQAVAAMAYGTASIPKVDKIFGPGNAYVTAAKQIVAQDPGGAAMDLPAGPSEVLVIAEPGARPEWVAADLLAQAEHDVASQALLVTTDAAFAESVKTAVSEQLARLSRREIAEKSLAAGRIILVPEMETALAVSNRYAPEHLIIHHADAAKYVPAITHAGSVFLGAWTPESAGDYASGTNHILPTSGYARVYGGLNVLSFMKSMTVQSLTHEGLGRLGPAIVTMAEAEGLDAHAAAVKIRTGGAI